MASTKSRCPSHDSAAAIIPGKLAETGQTLVFCDDTDLTGSGPH
jgi:hypothetical protein